MKNYGIVVAIAALVFTTAITAQEEAQIAMTSSTEKVATMSTYEPIEISTLPETISGVVATDFAGATVTEAYKDEEDNYKLVLTVGEESKTVYANTAGEWIEPNE